MTDLVETDIVDRLRERAASYTGGTAWQDMIRHDCTQAAVEIVRLREVVHLMRDTAVPYDEYELLRTETERLRKDVVFWRSEAARVLKEERDR